MYVVVVLLLFLLMIAIGVVVFLRYSWGKRRRELFLYGKEINRWGQEGYDVVNLRKLFDKLRKDLEDSDPMKKIRDILSDWGRKGHRFFVKALRKVTRWLQRIIGRKPSLIITKALVIVTILADIVLTLSAIGLLITKDVSMTVGIAIAVAGFILLVFSIRYVSRYKLKLGEAVIILVVSIVFVMFASSYLNINSFSDIKSSITGPFNTESDNSAPQQ